MPANVIVLHLRAKNDNNGNPRRFFAILDPNTGEVIETIDEGYKGSGAYRKKYPEAILGPTFDTTPECRREWLRES